MSKLYGSLLSDFGFIPEGNPYFESVDLRSLTGEITKDFPKLRRGDIVHFADVGDTNNRGKVIFDGKILVLLEEYYDERGTVPDSFLLNEFKDTRYFADVLVGDVVFADFEGAEWYISSRRGAVISSSFGAYYIFGKDGEIPSEDQVERCMDTGIFRCGDKNNKLIIF